MLTGAVFGFLAWAAFLILSSLMPGQNDPKKVVCAFVVIVGVGASLGYLLS